MTPGSAVLPQSSDRVAYNGDMWFETQYRTDKPEELDRAEYYQVQIDPRYINGSWHYFVLEKHGWFDDLLKKAVNHTFTLNTDEGFTDYNEALLRHREQQAHRAKEGFIYI